MHMKRNAYEIIALALRDAGCQVFTHVPGTGATQAFQACQELVGVRQPISFHEEVAYTVAHGAALVGRRAAALIKVHGFAKAANSVVDSLTAGTLAGMVTLLFDDPAGRHSDNILDSPRLLNGLEMPYLAPQAGELYPAILEAFTRSETLGLPVAVLINSNALDGELAYEPAVLPPCQLVYQRDPARRLLCPYLTGYQRQVLAARLAGADWRAIPEPPLPRIPEGFPPAAQPTLQQYASLFAVFQRLNVGFVAGDTGFASLFAFPPYFCVDVCTYMGGSLPLAVGAYLGGQKEAWAVCGDFAFIAAGQLGLLEAVQRGVPLKVLIFNNGIAATTGGQVLAPHLLSRILHGYESFVQPLAHPQDEAETERVLTAARQAGELRIVVANFRV